MKTAKLMIIILAIVFGMNNIADAQYNTNRTTTKKKAYPFVTISPFGGAIMPIGILNDNFKPGGTVGLDLGYRVNKEVGFYAKFGYYFMNSRITGAPVGNYIEFSGGPRYYFTKSNVKSAIFAEGGVGGYNFSQNSFVHPQDTVGGVVSQINDLRPGLNAGLGADIPLSETIGLIVKGKYNVVFTPNGSNSFVTALGGIEFKIR